MKNLITILVISVFSLTISNLYSQKELPQHHITDEEKELMPEYLSKVVKRKNTSKPEKGLRPVGEFEPSQGVIVSYPFGIPLNLIAEMSEDVTVTTIVQGKSEENQVLSQFRGAGVNLSNTNFLYASNDSYWTRDYSPIFIADENTISMMNFTYNRPREQDNNIPNHMSEFFNAKSYQMDLVHAGGNYMSDGVSVAVSTDLIWEENSTKTKEEINTIHKDFLGVTKLHVTDDPLGDYIKHVDCWGKFLDVDKVLITEVPRTNRNYARYEAVADYFKNQKSSWGNDYEIFRVMADDGQPYTNSLILNDKVLVPITGDPLDDAALESYRNAMPGYEVLGFRGRWETTDALHCRTHEISDLGMLDIQHNPILGEVALKDSYKISANIKAYSKQRIYNDSIKVYYSVNNSSFRSISMSNTSGDQYQAQIPKQSSGSKISYYIHAADESGRSENHPYIGKFDPHVFSVENVANEDFVDEVVSEEQVTEEGDMDDENVEDQVNEEVDAEEENVEEQDFEEEDFEEEDIEEEDFNDNDFFFDDDDFKIYPNPLLDGDEITVKFLKNKTIDKVQIYDLNGKMIIEKAIKNHSMNSISIKEIQISQGIYLVKLVGLKDVKTFKLLKM